jgi:hypothetical protein
MKFVCGAPQPEQSATQGLLKGFRLRREAER